MTGTDLVKMDDYMALNPSAGGLDILRDHLQENEVSEFDLGRVKIPSGGGTHWSVPTIDGEESVPALQGVIVFSKKSRSYWESTYEGGNEPPDCSAADAQHATQNNQDIEIPAAREEGSGYLLCDTCAYSDWGSAGEGKRGQACKLTRQLFLLIPDKLLPLVVSLPPTSLRPASKYFLDLADRMIDHKSVVTELALEKVSGQGVPDYSRVTFKRKMNLDPEASDKVAQYAAALQPHFDRVRVQDREEAGVAA